MEIASLYTVKGNFDKIQNIINEQSKKIVLFR